MDENLPILLNYEITGANINLRIDESGLCYFDLNKESISELSLKECQITDDLIRSLKESVGWAFEQEMRQEDESCVIEFYADYGRIWAEISCESFEQKTSNYTTEDLAQKGKLLAELYSLVYKRFVENDTKIYSLTTKLKSDLKNEIIRLERKSDFFKDTNKNKYETFLLQIKTLRNLLKTVEQLAED